MSSTKPPNFNGTSPYQQIPPTSSEIKEEDDPISEGSPLRDITFEPYPPSPRVTDNNNFSDSANANRRPRTFGKYLLAATVGGGAVIGIHQIVTHASTIGEAL